MQRINVTKTFLPPQVEYQKYLDMIWDRSFLTNQGPLLLEFEKKLSERLQLSNVHFVANGTLGLQVALKALDIIEGEIITTPFSYVATVSSILWERCTPVFVDIDPETLCIDAGKIEAAITRNTKAIMPVHVFGIPCDVDKINIIANKYNLKVIYDAAHAFGVKYNGRSLLDQGDASICSFHSTKLFHTIEGGLIVVKEDEVSEKTELIKRFGHQEGDHKTLGTNAKASEFQAAMGLCNLNYIDEIIEKRQLLSELYDNLLRHNFKRPKIPDGVEYNYGYYPIIVESEEKTLRLINRLAKENIFPRRYFSPSLNKLPYIKNKNPCPISEDIASRILCLPLYADLEESVVRKICGIITK